MYQQQSSIQQTEENFNKLIENFNENIYDTTQEPIDDKEYDMNKTYNFNHMSLWNNMGTRDLDFMIIQKNSQVALVAFDQNDIVEREIPLEVINCIVRLQDIE